MSRGCSTASVEHVTFTHDVSLGVALFRGNSQGSVMVSLVTTRIVNT